MLTLCLCLFRKKKGCRHSATSLLSVRLYAIVVCPLLARIKTTTPRHLRPSQTPSPCSPRPATRTPPRTITPCRLPSPTPPACIQPTARWAATTVTTARSPCSTNKFQVGGSGWDGAGGVTVHKQGDTKHKKTLWLSLVWCDDTVWNTAQENLTSGGWGWGLTQETPPSPTVFIWRSKSSNWVETAHQEAHLRAMVRPDSEGTDRLVFVCFLVPSWRRRSLMETSCSCFCDCRLHVLSLKFFDEIFSNQWWFLSFRKICHVVLLVTDLSGERRDSEQDKINVQFLFSLHLNWCPDSEHATYQAGQRSGGGACLDQHCWFIRLMTVYRFTKVNLLVL